MHRLLLIALLPIMLLCSPSAQAQTKEKDDSLVKIRLLPERTNINPGEEFQIAIDQVIAEHWHTYWENPGDSGTPLRITWTLPQGWKAGPLLWPAPHKIPYEPLMNFGYENSATLLQSLKAPKNLPEGPIDLSADIEVLVCKEECIPEYAAYHLTLNDPQTTPEDNSAYIEMASAKIPVQSDWQATFTEENGNLVITTTPPEDIAGAIDPQSLEFFPREWGLIENTAKPKATIENNKLTISQTRGERPISAFKTAEIVLRYKANDGKDNALTLNALPNTKAPAADHPTSTARKKQSATQKPKLKTTQNISLLGAALFAILGGLILNLMPCVFPVLSIKALSLIKISEKHPALARLHGLSYTAGVIASFVIIAATLIALKSAGSEIGWGFQLQNPLMIGLLVYLLFLISLNLIGLFEVSGRFGNAGSKLAGKEGLTGSFFTGVLATLVATPCTAPFMAGALGFALLQPAAISLLIFALLGLGLALPYLVLSFIPALQKAMPKPGAWMDIFKQLLAFPMFAATIWLIWVLGMQTGADGIISILIGMALLSFAIWMLRHKPKDRFWRGLTTTLALISIFLAITSLPPKAMIVSMCEVKQSSLSQSFSPGKLETLLQGDDPVFVEMTAAWCITCKVNHAAALNIDSTRQLFEDNNVQYLIGDWTNEDPQITEFLDSYGRSGVPLYVYYPPRDAKTGQRAQEKILPQILTPGIVRDYIEGRK